MNGFDQVILVDRKESEFFGFKLFQGKPVQKNLDDWD